MKNLKKTLAVVLAFVMVLSMGLTSFAYTDVTAGTKVAEAVGVLSNLNILTGFEDGTFRPDETVTRAQMAAIICRLLGMDDQAASSQGTTVFSDVAADHWASGYINVAQAQQIINGYPDGTFRPENQVAYEEAIKMVVVALGRELEAQKKGGWSQGYLASASSAGITKNANGTVGSAAARSTIAILAYNALEVRLMDQSSWTTSGDDDRFVLTDDTILSKYLEVEKWEGIVKSVPVVDYVTTGYTEDADVVMDFATGTVKVAYSDGKITRTAVESADLSDIDCSLVPEVNMLAGKKVVAYIGEDAETGVDKVVAIAEKEGANTELTISANQLITSGTDLTTDGSIFYKKIGAKKATEVALADAITVSGNYGAMDTDGGRRVGAALEDYDTADLANLFTNGGTITFISNDGDDKIDAIQVIDFAAEAVIEEVKEQDGIIEFATYSDTDSLAEIDTEDKDVLYIVYKDGEVATVADLAANDTVSIVDSADFHDASVVVLYASSKTVTGSIESKGADNVVIAGEKYEISAAYGVSAATLYDTKKDGIFFLNVDGQIAYADATNDLGDYALIVAAGTTTGLDTGYVVEVVLADGTKKTYDLYSKVDATSFDGVSEKTDDAAYAKLAALMPTHENEAETAVYADKANLTNLIVRIKVADGEIRKITQLTSGTTADDKKFDEENMTYGNVLFNDETVVFSCTVDSGKVEAKDIVVGKVADFFVDGEGGADITAYDEDNQDIAGLVLGFDLTTPVPLDGDAVIISEEINSFDIDDVDAYEITGIQGGEKVTYTICSEDAFTSSVNPEDLEPGDVILVGPANADGIVTDFITLFTYENGETLVATDSPADDIYYAYGTLVEDPAPADSKFFLTSVTEGGSYCADDCATDHNGAEEEGLGDHNYGIYTGAEGIVMKNSANYTLVEVEDGYVEVSKKSKGKGIFGAVSRYDSKVLVRYYDEKLVEVIVYRVEE